MLAVTSRPQNDFVQVVGDAQKRWLSAHIYNIYVDGVGKFNRFEAIEQTHFKNKTLYLASTGDITSIDGGGETGLTIIMILQMKNHIQNHKC